MASQQKKSSTVLSKISSEFPEAPTRGSFIPASQRTSPIKLGYLDNIKVVVHAQTKKCYFLKEYPYSGISHLNSELEKIYSATNPNTIDLISHFTEDNLLWLIFHEIPKFTTLEFLIENYELNEPFLFNLYLQILNTVNILHQKGLYGCMLTMESFIFDLNEKKIKFTDVGFSKIFPKNKDLFPYKNDKGIEYNEYTPVEYLLRDKQIDDNSTFNETYKEECDTWQLGILFLKMAASNKSAYVKFTYDDMIKYRINFELLNSFSEVLINLISRMLPKDFTQKSQSDKKFTVKSAIEYINNNTPYGESKASSSRNIDNNVSDSDKNDSSPIYPNVVPKHSNKNTNQIKKKLETNSLLKLNAMYKDVIKVWNKVKNDQEQIKKWCNGVEEIISKNKADTEEKNNEMLTMIQSLNFQQESIESFHNYIKKTKNIGEDKYQEIISYLFCEFKTLKVNLDIEKNKNSDLAACIEEKEKENKELRASHEKEIQKLKDQNSLLEKYISVEDGGDSEFRALREIKEKLIGQSETVKKDINEQIAKFLAEMKGKIN